MVLYYLTAEIESHTSCLAGGLGGEEGVEELFDDCFLDANTIVVDSDDNSLVCLCGLKTDFWRTIYCRRTIRRSITPPRNSAFFSTNLNLLIKNFPYRIIIVFCD